MERRDVDRDVTDADEAFQEKTIEMDETHEEAVVSKEARVTGEVVVEKGVTEHTETVSDTVRKTEVEVEEVGTQATSTKLRRRRRGFTANTTTRTTRVPDATTNTTNPLTASAVT